MNVEPSGDFNIDARMEEIVGKPQRIAPLAEEELSPEGRELCARIRKSFNASETDALPKVFATMLKHPGLYRCQLEMGIELVANGKLPPRERELAILRNAWLCGAPYEWGEHVDIAKRVGITTEEIEATTEGAKAELWNEHERAILRAVDELHMHKTISDETWDVLAASWDEQQLMEFPVLVGQYISTALLQNSLRIRLADDNPGLGYR
jgi:4-carboxymuconolactone decarboxylase